MSFEKKAFLLAITIGACIGILLSVVIIYLW